MADVFSLDKLSIKKLKALAGRNKEVGHHQNSARRGRQGTLGPAAGDVLVERGDAEACPAV